MYVLSTFFWIEIVLVWNGNGMGWYKSEISVKWDGISVELLWNRMWNETVLVWNGMKY